MKYRLFPYLLRSSSLDVPRSQLSNTENCVQIGPEMTEISMNEESSDRPS